MSSFILTEFSGSVTAVFLIFLFGSYAQPFCDLLLQRMNFLNLDLFFDRLRNYAPNLARNSYIVDGNYLTSHLGWCDN